jgi:hypothetical protein
MSFLLASCFAFDLGNKTVIYDCSVCLLIARYQKKHISLMAHLDTAKEKKHNDQRRRVGEGVVNISIGSCNNEDKEE